MRKHRPEAYTPKDLLRSPGMLRHVIAPARFFAQIPNELLRHPRLSSHAVHLLTWQLSLPPDARESLSDTARRARIKKTAFQRAKQELIKERYLHEWRVQTGGGHWATVQLVSNTPLSAEEAAAVRDGQMPPHGGARLITEPAPEAGEPENPQVAPSGPYPAVGQPTGRPAARQPKKNTEGNTSHQPSAVRLAQAEALLRSLAAVDPRLAVPARTARDWAPLAARWLEEGLRPDRIRHTLTTGLGHARSPLGALRWRLEHAMPEAPPPPPPAESRAEPRLARMRECAGKHTQARLFVPAPGSGETRCADCRASGATARPAASPPPAQPDGTGYELFRAARRANGLAGRPREAGATTPV